MSELHLYTTTRCNDAGHKEIVAYAPDLPVPGMVQRLLTYLENRVLDGEVFEVEEAIQYGWSVFRIQPHHDGRLLLTEPDMNLPMNFVETVHISLMQVFLQNEVVASVGLLEQIEFPAIFHGAMACEKVVESDRILLSRGEPVNDESGWLITCLDANHDHEAEGALKGVSLYEMACRIPPIVQFFGLPAGCSVAVLGPGRIRAVVFHEGVELTPTKGSYLEALSGSSGT